MANLASVLKEEVSRIVQQEVRRQTAGTAKAAAQGQREVAALKTQLEKLQNQLASLRGQETPKQAVSKKAGRKKTARKTAESKQERGKNDSDAAVAAEKQALRKRFSAQALKTDRERLGLSADNYGKLIGVSGLSIYNWEQEKARPRDSSIEALMQIKGIGKRKAQKLLKNSRVRARKRPARRRPARRRPAEKYPGAERPASCACVRRDTAHDSEPQANPPPRPGETAAGITPTVVSCSSGSNSSSPTSGIFSSARTSPLGYPRGMQQ